MDVMGVVICFQISIFDPLETSEILKDNDIKVL